MKRIPHPPKHKNKSEPKFILHYRLDEVIGHGAWGKVKKGWDGEERRPVAIKILCKKRISRKIRNGLDRIKTEFEMLKNLNHPNVVKYYDLIETVKDEDPVEVSYSNNNSITTTSTSAQSTDSLSTKTSSSLASYRSIGDGKVFLVMEWLGEGKPLSFCHLNEKQLKSVLKQLLEAVLYLIEQGIAHHDIKPENIIYNEKDDKLTLIDFGVAERCENGRSFCGFGTPAYQPPELIKRSDHEVPISGEKADLWSVGVVAFQLCTGELPFEGDSIHAVFEQICQHRPDFSKITNSQLKLLIKGLLEKNPNKRLDAKEALNHPYCITETESKPFWRRLLCI